MTKPEMGVVEQGQYMVKLGMGVAEKRRANLGMGEVDEG